MTNARSFYSLYISGCALAVRGVQSSRVAILSELWWAYRGTAIALTVLVMVTTWSHVHRTRAVRTLSLSLPAYVATFEACRHFTWSLRCHSMIVPPTLAELRHGFRIAAIASVIAVVIALIVAVALAKWCRDGVSGEISWRAVCALAPLASVVVLWASMDRIFLGTA